MNEPININDTSLAVTLTVGQLRALMREEIEKAQCPNRHKEGDSLLSVDEAAKVLSVSRDWLYRHGKKLGLARPLSPRSVKYSSQAIQRYLTTRKVS